MEKRAAFTKVLAVSGAAITWIPILFTVATSAIGTIARGVVRFDYLMPAELFPFALVGGLLLMWAALRAHSHRKLIGWGLAAQVLFLVGGQALAVVTGLASGATGPTGWAWALVLSSLALYSLALIGVCVSGVLLARKLYRSA